jgi:hypothetical protein
VVRKLARSTCRKRAVDSMLPRTSKGRARGGGSRQGGPSCLPERSEGGEMGFLS